MSWKKARIVEEVLAEALESDEGIGIARIFDSDGEPICMIGKALDALGITREQYDESVVEHRAQLDCLFGCNPEDREKLRKVMCFNDGDNLWDTLDYSPEQDQPKAAEMLVSAIKEFVPDDS